MYRVYGTAHVDELRQAETPPWVIRINEEPVDDDPSLDALLLRVQRRIAEARGEPVLLTVATEARELPEPEPEPEPAPDRAALDELRAALTANGQ